MIISERKKGGFQDLVRILPIILALCSMLSSTYYAQNYASIIGGSLKVEPYLKSDFAQLHQKICWVKLEK